MIFIILFTMCHVIFFPNSQLFFPRECFSLNYSYSKGLNSKQTFPPSLNFPWVLLKNFNYKGLLVILDAFIEKLQKTKKEKREKKKIRYLYPRGEKYLKNCTHYWTINKKPKIVHEYIVCDKIISSMFHEINPM